MFLLATAVTLFVCMVLVLYIVVEILGTDPAFSGTPSEFLKQGVTMLFVIFLPAGLILYLLAGRPLVEARKRHLARKKSDARRVTIGSLFSTRQGLWLAGSFIPIQEFLLNLQKVEMTANPPLLHLRRKHLFLRQSSWSDTMRILVPRGHEAEAAWLIERFRKETIASRMPKTPPEPR